MYVVTVCSCGERVKRSKVLVILAIALSFGFLAFSSMATAQDDDPRIEVYQGKSDRLTLADQITIRVGDALFGVEYGSVANPGPITMFAVYKRHIGGADVYDEDGDHLRTMPIKISSVYSQTLTRLVEFEDVDDDDLFDLRNTELNPLVGDIPTAALNLVQSWQLTDYKLEKDSDSASLDFKLSINDVPYTWILQMPGVIWNGSQSTDRVEEVAITFHIDVSLEDALIQEVPWFKITVGGFPDRRITDHELTGYRDFEGKSLQMDFKYDHYISGWDFNNDSNLLAMDTRLRVGTFLDAPTAKLVYQESKLRAVEENGDVGNYEVGENDEEPETPVLIENNRIQFYDDQHPLGMLTWVHEVEVDGVEKDMVFEVYNMAPDHWFDGRVHFKGFSVFGAFIYPQGQTICHDPQFSDSVYIFSIPEVVNVLPQGVMMAQLALGAVGIAFAVALSIRKKKKLGGD